MAYLVDSDRLIVTDGGGTDAVELVDCKEYKIINTLKLGPGVDHGRNTTPSTNPFTLKMVAAQMRRPMCSALLTPIPLNKLARLRDFLEIPMRHWPLTTRGKNFT